ncbi:MAG: hypothetical protein ACRCSV_00610 [Chlamydiales bacterium]
MNLQKDDQIIDLKHEILALKENNFEMKESLNQSKQFDKKREAEFLEKTEEIIRLKESLNQSKQFGKKREAELLEKNQEIVRLKESISQRKQLDKEKESKSRQEQLYKEKLLKDKIELKNMLFEKDQNICSLEKYLNFFKEDQETKSFYSAYAISKRKEERAKEEQRLRFAACIRENRFDRECMGDNFFKFLN